MSFYKITLCLPVRNAQRDLTNVFDSFSEYKEVHFYFIDDTLLEDIIYSIFFSKAKSLKTKNIIFVGHCLKQHSTTEFLWLQIS